ncbi:non-structural maintenance of chromosomes element 1 homolog [Chelonus insularis]|uniref:non-structural maintenance of chromosomes element 1 homolog n=1 Tax=Chelonus insularis TaxID=460826 RepID=UPI001589F56D|nr:non-structural maintenance of chromosomes element 1 homolog [Chelonus insularis]
MENRTTLSQPLKKVLQVISHHGILSEQDLQKFIEKICGNDRNSNFMAYISKINAALNEVDLTVKSSICELTGQKYWTLSSTVLNESDDENEDDQPNRKRNLAPSQSSQNPQANDDDENDLMLSSFTKPQIELFKLICEDIMLHPAHCVPSNNCINLVGVMKGRMVRSEAERFLKQAIKGLWFTMKDGQVYIGPRSIAELMPFFKANYEAGLTTCSICNYVIFYGHTCEQCDSRIHYHCLANMLKFTPTMKCLRCQKPLNIDRDDLLSYSSSQLESNDVSQRSLLESNDISQRSQSENNDISQMSQPESRNVSQRPQKTKRGER